MSNLMEERELYIRELEAELTALEEDNDNHQDQLVIHRDKIASLESENKRLRREKDDLYRESSDLKNEVSVHRSQLDAQKGVIAAAAKSSADSKRLQNENNQCLHRLEVENQRLRSVVLEIEENEDILVNEIETLVKENSEYRAENEELNSKCDQIYADLDEKVRVHSQLSQETEKAQNDLETQQLSHRQDREEWERKDAASKSEITRLLTELEQEKAKHKENVFVKENELFRTELVKIRRENAKLHSLFDQCQRDKNQAERDLDSAIHALNRSKWDAKEEILSAVREERVSLKDANDKLEAAEQKESILKTKCADAEVLLEDVRKRLEQAEERNASYEKNHGLTEVIRHQRKLEADIRRRDHDLKRLTAKLGAELEKYRMLNKACEWLKEKAGVGKDFSYDDDEVQAALALDDNRLKSENAELSRQIESLEGERTKLLAQLRERAVDIGDQGVRFLGMDAQSVAQVMEFASSLRRGVAELPLNDRSKELMSEVATLKSEREVMKVTIERLERELFALAEADAKPPGETSLVFQNALRDMTIENQTLRDEIDALKGESASDPGGSALTPTMRERAKELLGVQDLVSMPPAAEVQFMCLMNEYDKVVAKQRAGEHPAIAATDLMHQSKPDGESAGDRAGAHPLQQTQTTTGGAYEERLLYLEEWKQNATEVMEKQLASLDSAADSTVEERERTVELVRSILRDIQKQDGLLSRPSIRHAAREELKCMNESLHQASLMLVGYSADVNKLRRSLFDVEKNRADADEHIQLQITCLNEIIQEKDRIIKQKETKLATAKQMNLKLSRERDNQVPKKCSEHSISTSSIDRSLVRAANASYQEKSSSRNLRHATAVVLEKEETITAQRETISEIEQKLICAHDEIDRVMNENESMKKDVSTLLARLTAAESEVESIHAYQKKCEEMQATADRKEAETTALKVKLQALKRESTDKDKKIAELVESVARTKRILSVARQARARSESSLKASNEEIACHEETIDKLNAQISGLKQDKVDAQNEKVKLSRKARASASKLKDLTDECNRKGGSTAIEELEKRVAVLNKTVSGLASTNSKLRGEVASQKLLRKKAEEDAQQTKRPSTASRAKSLEEQVQTLKKSLDVEKKTASESSKMLDRYQKKIQALEQALKSSEPPAERSSDESNSMELERLQQELKCLADDNKTLTLKIAELKRENERLSQVDHLDFFEEIEDLKYKYNEAVRQLNQIAR